MLVVTALRVAGEAARRLRTARTGRLHSAYARTLNLELDGLGDAGWLSLHGAGPVPAPFGIASPLLPRPGAVAPGARVVIAPAAVVIPGVLRVTLEATELVETTLPSAAPAPAVAHALAALGGFLGCVVARGAAAPLGGDPLARLAGPALERLATATAAGDAAACVAAAGGLLGLGPGLTPGGDDCLVGWLAGLLTAGPAGRGLAAAAGPPLLAAARERTTALSRAFLAAAVAGQVAEPVRAFVVRPDTVRLAALLALGATSGGDILAGYLLARDALGGAARRGRPPARRVGTG